MSKFKIGDVVKVHCATGTPVISAMDARAGWHSVRWPDGRQWHGLEARQLTLVEEPKKKLDLRRPVELCGPAEGEKVLLAVWHNRKGKNTVLVTAEDEHGHRYQYTTDAHGMSGGGELILRNVPEAKRGQYTTVILDELHKAQAESEAEAQFDPTTGMAPAARRTYLEHKAALLRTVHVPVKAEPSPEDLAHAYLYEYHRRKAEPKFKAGDRVRTKNGDTGVIILPVDLFGAYEVRHDGEERSRLWLPASLTPLKTVKYNVRRGLDGKLRTFAEGSSDVWASHGDIVHTFELEVEDV